MSKKVEVTENTENEEVNNEEVINEEVKEEFVPKKAYEQTSADMHKFKSTAKKLEAELNRIKVELEEERKAKLEEKGEYKSLWEASEQKLAKIEQEKAQKEKENIIKSKIQHVSDKLGGFKKPEYAKFINLDAVETDEETGLIIESSLIKEVDRIRQNHAELINVAVTTRMPSGAASSGASIEKSLDDMTESELNALIKKANRGQL